MKHPTCMQAATAQLQGGQKWTSWLMQQTTLEGALPSNGQNFL